MNARTLAVMSVFFAAGCAGGSGFAPATTGPIVSAPPTGTPIPLATSAFLTIAVPGRASSVKRSPRYVSPNSASIAITVISVNGSAPNATQVPVNPTTVALSNAGGGNCAASGNGQTCSVPLPAPTGAVQYLLRVMDGAEHVLSQNTVTFTIVPAVANQTFSAQLDGVVARVVATLPKLSAGTSFSGPITVGAYDASGALITGSAPFANAFTLTDNDRSGHTSLTVNATTGLTVTVSTPNDVVILNYDGQPDGPVTVTANIPPG